MFSSNVCKLHVDKCCSACVCRVSALTAALSPLNRLSLPQPCFYNKLKHYTTLEPPFSDVGCDTQAGFLNNNGLISKCDPCASIVLWMEKL